MMKKCIFFIFGLTFFFQFQTNASTDSLYFVLLKTDSITSPKAYINTSVELGEEYMYESDFKKANQYFKNALLLSSQHHFTELTYPAQLGLARSFQNQGKYELSLKHSHELLDKLPKDSLRLRGRVFQLTGMSNVYQGNFDGAYKAQMSALDIYKTIGDSSMMARVEYGIGTNFFYQDQFDLSKLHYKNALKISEAIGLREGVHIAMGAIGSVLEKEGNFEEALQLNEESMKMAEEDGDKQGVAWSLYNIGSVLCELGRCQEGLEKLEQCRKMSIEMGDKGLEGYTYSLFASIYKDQSQFDKALKYLQSSHEIAKSDNDISSILEILKEFSDVYFKKKDYKKFKDFHDQYYTLKDSLYNKDLVESLSSLTQDFEIQQLQKEQEITLLKKEQELQQMESNVKFGVAGAVSTIVFLLFWITYSRNKNEREKNKILAQKNEEVNRQNERLIASNQDLEKFAQMISHDLREPLRNISGFTSLLERKLQGKDNLDENMKEYMGFITSGAKQMGNLLTDILDYSKLDIGEEEEEEIIDANEVVWQVTDDLQDIAQETNTIFIVPELPKVYYNKKHLYQIFHHLFSNAIHFRSEKSPQVEVGVCDDENYFSFFVKDNGIGIDPEYHERIFVIFQRLHDRGTYTGSGLGLPICRKIIESNGGSIFVKSEEGLGATFFFTIPKQQKVVTPNNEVKLPKEVISLN